MNKILITNDDGIDSAGIIKLAKAALEVGEVWIVAPDSQRSACSHSFTFTKPLKVWEHDIGIEGVHAFACDGTPADCMRVGILKVVPGGPDYAFSGVNNGLNICYDVQYSGTVGAAMEGAYFGVHSLAFSQQDGNEDEVMDRYMLELMKEYMNKPLTKNQIWNINFPKCSLADCKGVMRDVKVSRDSFYDDNYSETELEDGVKQYDVIYKRLWEATPGTDLAAIIDGYVSVGLVNNLG
ncbi:MAG: 5'/3'-nucleotidase SurE [Lachnospiraceae bacterium]|nr:5'/3'-nucleotidase SurE [Lachnospiraceae bacterium]